MEKENLGKNKKEKNVLFIVNLCVLDFCFCFNLGRFKAKLFQEL